MIRTQTYSQNSPALFLDGARLAGQRKGTSQGAWGSAILRLGQGAEAAKINPGASVVRQLASTLF